MKFSALNVNFSSLSSDALDSKWPAHAGVKEGYPSKKVFIYSLLQIGIDMLLIITSNGDTS